VARAEAARALLSYATSTGLVHPQAVNPRGHRRATCCPRRRPAAFHAIGEWLRAAFSDLAWTTERDVVDDDLVVTYGMLSGRHTGDFVAWTPQGTVARAFVPTGKAFSVRQAHFQRVADGLVVEHWAARDDQAWPSSSAGSHPAQASCSAAIEPRSGLGEPPAWG
jgi:predicted ester cyclase